MNREEEIYAAAVELPLPERSAFLDTACRGDPVLRQRVETLLAGNEAADEFFAVTALTRPLLAPEEKPGDWLGPYRLLQKIGEGGCGVVYMAEQEQPLRRRVALKVIKLGMDTKAVMARFDAERQVLALMDHPNIARVFDAGATPAGRPFFVMELVRGIPITRFCDEDNLSTEQRLQLFVQVCHAIQHAHTKGIVHRDIKPANVLVARYDDVAVPKVIDFGVAKATQGPLTDQTLFTAFEQFIGTPAYMSPEQAQLNAIDIDARSDIYSLGVLAYELLTGQPPFDPRTLRERGLDEIRRIIREVEPPTPSTRLSSLTAADRTTIAARRGIAQTQLTARLRGDLDWIVMKALEKNRARRYSDASGLADDINRHLRDQPVLARPASLGYRAQKFVRRRRFILTAAALAALALVTGLGLARVLFRADSGWPNQRERGPAIQVLLSGTGPEFAGVLSPDETMLAFVDWKAGGGGIAVKNLKTGETKTLTPLRPGSFDFAAVPVWSPDSKAIAYQWCDGSKGDETSLRIIAAEGGVPRIIRRGGAEMVLGPSDWSRDGKSILGYFTEADRRERLAVVSPETGELRPITPPLWPRANHARFSLDGTAVVYDCVVDGNRNAFLVEVSTGRISRVTDSVSPVEDASPIFSADGKSILFSSNRGEGWDLWSVDRNPGPAMREPLLVKYDFGDREKRMTDPGRLAFAIPGNGHDIYEVDGLRAPLGPAGEPRRLTRSFRGQHASPAWSPDGRKLAYVRSRGNAGRATLLCVQSMADRREQSFETGIEFVRRLFWSPDGTALAISGQGDGNEIGIYYFSLTTRTRFAIKVVSGVPPWPIGFSPDGREFVFCRWDQTERMAFDLATQTARPVASPEDAVLATAPRDRVREHDLSPDGLSLAFVIREGGEQLLVVSELGGQNRRVIARAPAGTSVGAPRWSPDGTRIAFFASTAAGMKAMQLRVAGADGTWQRTVNTGRRFVSPGSIPPSWSPDGSKLAVTLGEDVIGEVGVLANFGRTTTVAGK